ncbi:hypothetical protein AMTR_s00156p00059750 [Amborella trichopoda]|uniref:Cell division protein FtsZ C-terminal domain-containing protein n=1 Tax=Amborella trichopoda TaxID=13333 RepID=W1PKP0_AMBTC|nr:hypothetical protein AMTR_s00156p00059750 [Amborella trichopoda]
MMCGPLNAPDVHHPARFCGIDYTCVNLPVRCTNFDLHCSSSGMLEDAHGVVYTIPYLIVVCILPFLQTKSQDLFAMQVVTSLADPAANIIFGAVIDDKYHGEIHVTIIATGFSQTFQKTLLTDPSGKSSMMGKQNARTVERPSSVLSPGKKAFL